MSDTRRPRLDRTYSLAAARAQRATMPASMSCPGAREAVTAGSQEEAADRGCREPLWTLHQLDIEDKHRLLVLCPSLVKALGYNVPEAAVGCRVRLALRPAENGAEVLRMYDLPQPAHSLDIEPQGDWGVWVGETEETAYVEVMALDVLFRPVESIIDGFEQHG